MGLTDSIEDRLGALAHEAGQALLTEGQILKAEDEDLHLVPVLRHIANVQMIGIARLRYRPQTQLTSAWWAELHKKCESYLQKYQKLANG